MPERAQYVKHIELYVDSSSFPSQQAASVDSLASLLKNGLLTLKALVRDMDLYLTTTDSIIRSRGILLLGELLTQLNLMPLSDGAIHCLIRFFTERLEDWRALRGALVGCLALIRRKSGVGLVKDNDAKALTESFMQSLQVQSLGQHDHKLCHGLLDCLLDPYPNAVRPLVFPVTARDLFLYEKKMKMVVSVEMSYPGHLTLAFGSTPIFEPYAIPLLIDKLSSSLPSAKVDSLKYLVHCSLKYGSDRMSKHAEERWPFLKDVLYTSPQSALSMVSESSDGLVFEERVI